MKRKFIIGTCLLTATSLFLRAVGIFFHSRLSRVLGAEGMGIFSQIMAVYRFGITLAVSGIGLAGSKIVAEELAEKHEKGVRKAVNVTLLHGAVFGVFAAVLMMAFSEPVCRKLLGDEQTKDAVRLFSLSLPFVAMSSALHGYFTAADRVGRSAVIQILEQGIHVTLCLSLIGRTHDSYEACMTVAATGTVADIIAFAVLFILYRADARTYKNEKSGKKITKRILSVSLPVAASAYLRSGLSSLEHALTPTFLAGNAMGKSGALASYGTVHGMVLPLIYFPSAALQAFATLLIPRLAVCLQKKQKERIRNLVERSLRAAMIFSVGVSCLLFFFAEEIGKAVYQTKEVAPFIRILAPLTVAMYADSVVDGALKGLNQQVYSMGYNIIDAALALVLMPVILPKYGTAGYILIIYITELTNAFFSIQRLFCVSSFRFQPIRWALLPYLAATACCILFKTAPGGLFGVLASICTFSFFALLFYGKPHNCA